MMTPEGCDQWRGSMLDVVIIRILLHHIASTVTALSYLSCQVMPSSCFLCFLQKQDEATLQ